MTTIPFNNKLTHNGIFIFLNFEKLVILIQTSVDYKILYEVHKECQWCEVCATIVEKQWSDIVLTVRCCVERYECIYIFILGLSVVSEMELRVIILGICDQLTFRWWQVISTTISAYLHVLE